MVVELGFRGQEVRVGLDVGSVSVSAVGVV